MATTISITTGALSASRTFQDDTRARAALLKFYTAYNLGPDDASPQAKLDAVLEWIINSIQDAAMQRHIDEGRAALEQDAKSIYEFNKESVS